MEKLTGFTVVVKDCNLGGAPVGASHHYTRWPDEVVAQAKAMRAQGMSYRDISAALGPSISSAHRYVNGTSRKPATRRIARRVKTRETPG